MKKHLLLPFVLFSLNIVGQGFDTTAINWPAPDGGKKSGSITLGFNGLGGAALVTDDAGSQSWTIADLNGDGNVDLVVMAEKQAGYVTSFSPTSSQYWKVYLNSGSGFSSVATIWPCPDGGRKSGGITYGFTSFLYAATAAEDTGSQSWHLLEMNGDGKLDLVVFAEKQSGNVTSFSPTSSQYWKVYLNTGTGFSLTPIIWSCPDGGDITGGVTYGYYTTSSAATETDNDGSQSWSLLDLNGDTKLDLAVTAQLQTGYVTTFSPGVGQYWKAYLNSGSGFSLIATNWVCPLGGKISSSVPRGFIAAFSVASSTLDNNYSQSSATVDINGDGKPDLVVTGELYGGNVTSFSPTSSQYWIVYLNTGSSFSTTGSNWSLPSGGDITGGVEKGFYVINNNAIPTDDPTSQSWSLVDLNGDDKSDLVVLASLEGGDVLVFSSPSGQFWQVSINNGTGFNAPINWTCPDGGDITSGVVKGFNAIAGNALSTETTGSQSWSANYDINGDSRNDLIVPAELQAGNVTSYSPSSSQYWKVYLGYSVSTGVGEIDNNTEFLVFPNPTDGLINFQSEKQKNRLTIEWYDVVGSLLLKKQFEAFNTTQIDISKFENGVYFLLVYENEGSLIETKRVIKQ